MDLIFSVTANEVNKQNVLLSKRIPYIMKKISQVYYFQCNPDQRHLYFNICYIHLDPVQQIKQAEQLKSRKMKDKGGWVFCRQTDGHW